MTRVLIAGSLPWNDKIMIERMILDRQDIETIIVGLHSDVTEIALEVARKSNIARFICRDPLERVSIIPPDEVWIFSNDMRKDYDAQNIGYLTQDMSIPVRIYAEQYNEEE